MGVVRTLRAEFAVVVGVATAILFLVFGKAWVTDLSSPLWEGFLFLWVFGVMVWLAFGVVRHADCLAILLGEPFGTLILTLSVISIEVVMIAAVMLTSENNAALARDTMFAVLMIVLNGMIGACMLVGAWRHVEPVFRLEGANAYMGVIVPLAILTLVLPRFTESSPGGEPSVLLGVFLAIASVVLYGVFLGIQTLRHRGYFHQPEARGAPGGHDDRGDLVIRGVAYHAVMLPLSMLPIVVLSKSMAKLIEHGLDAFGLPPALAGVLVAVIVLSPEGLAALRSASKNKMQRSINICLGSALATIGLTVPVVLVISLASGKPIELGLEPVEIVVLAVTILTLMVNTASGRTNVLQGAVHLLLFAAYAVLIFD